MEHNYEEVMELLASSKQPKKNNKQLIQLIWLIFGNPETIADKFCSPTRKTSNDTRAHNLNIEMILALYRSVYEIRKNTEICACLEKTFTRLEQEGELKTFLKNQDRLKYFYIVLLWDSLFKEPNFRLLLMRFLGLLAQATTSYPNFIDWLDDLPTDRIAFLVESTQRELEAEFQKVNLGAIDPNPVKEPDVNIRRMCIFLSLLHKSNESKRRLPKQAFINNKISQYFEPVGQFKLFLKNVHNMNLIDFPFLLALDYKYRLLQIESVFEQKVNIQKSMEAGLANLLSGQMEQYGQLSVEGLVFLHFQITRTNILDDSMEKLGKTTKNLKSPLRIQFLGEEGADEGGVKNQYFQLLIKQIFNPYLDMFVPKNHGRVYWFNSFSYEPPIRFQFVGMLLGLSIYNSVHLDIHFPKVLYSKLLSKNEHEQSVEQLLHHLSSLQPQMANGLKKILDSHQSLEDLQLYFNIEFEHFGEKIIEQLVEDGSSIRVTQDNKTYYVQLYTDYLLNKHTEKQFNAFKKGFLKVVSGGMIHTFDSQQLQNIICGSQNIDFKQLEENCNYEGGYSANTAVIKNLWLLLHSFTLQEKKQFLVFLTGSDRVPIEGLKALNMVIQKQSSNSQHLPTAHTCFNVLLLPEYPTKAKLEQKIRLILINNQGFGLI